MIRKVSVFVRNRCPFSTGTTVRFQRDLVSEITGICMKTLLSVALTIILLSCQREMGYNEKLEKLSTEHQKCLDSGIAMMNCSQKYAVQMDSMLNVVYKDLMDKYNKPDQEKLKAEERNWIKERDVQLEKIWASVNSANQEGFAPEDDRMIAYEEEADFIKLRVEELIRKLESIE